MKLSTIVFVLAGTSQAFLGCTLTWIYHHIGGALTSPATKRNDVDINAESSAGSLLSRSMSMFTGKLKMKKNANILPRSSGTMGQAYLG